MVHTNTEGVTYKTSGFLLRTPLLPLNRLIAWSHYGDNRPQTQAEWMASWEAHRKGLLAALSDSYFSWALRQSSVHLMDSIRYWLADPSSKKGLQVERALVRYFFRACSRPTPFGGLAGISWGYFGPKPEKLLLSDTKSYTVSSSLDYEVMWEVAHSLMDTYNRLPSMRFFANTTLSKSSGTINIYTHGHAAGGQQYLRLRLADDHVLRTAVSAAKRSTTRSQLAKVLNTLPGYTSLTSDEVSAYIADLLDNEVLISDFTLFAVTASVLGDLRQRVEHYGLSEEVRKLTLLGDALSEVDRNYPYAAEECLNKVATCVQTFIGTTKPARVSSTLHKPLHANTLPNSIAIDILQAVTALNTIGLSPRNDKRLLCLFRKSYRLRYGERWTPLLEVLDESSGIGFSGGPPLSSPLTEGVTATSTLPDAELTTFHLALLDKLLAHPKDGGPLRLSPSDFPRPLQKQNSLPDAFCVLASVMVDADPGLTDEQSFSVYLKAGAGPSGAVLLAKFASGEPNLHEAVGSHILQEESLVPDAIYAELCCLPADRTGAITERPHLRSYEITCGSLSSLPRERQIALEDLLITVTADDQILLYSILLKKRVIPRLSSALDFDKQHLSVPFRFLAYLQYEPWLSVPQFSWGPLASSAYLPRVMLGPVVIGLQTWKLQVDSIRQVTTPKAPWDSYMAVQQLRAREKLPRMLALVEDDTSLLVDLDNPMSVDVLVQAIRHCPTAILQEVPDLTSPAVTSPEGVFCNEIAVPFCRVHGSSLTYSLPAITTVSGQERSFPPGSQWLYLKLYVTLAALDDFVVYHLKDLSEQIAANHEVQQWFFIRYSDPEPHIRLRYEINEGCETSGLMMGIHQHLGSRLGPSGIWRLEISTYEREIERYGGLQSTILSERVFAVDSAAVCDMLMTITEQGAGVCRWQLACVGIHSMLDAFDLLAEERIVILSRCCTFLETELNLKHSAINNRVARKSLFAMLDSGIAKLDGPLRGIVTERLRLLRECANELRCSNSSTPLPVILSSYMHLYANRLMASEPQIHEYASYRALISYYTTKSVHSTQIEG